MDGEHKAASGGAADVGPASEEIGRGGGQRDAAARTRTPAEEVGHAVTRDQVAWTEAKPSLLEYLGHARRRSGRRPIELAREFARLQRGPGRLTWKEYVQYGVYDRARYSTADQQRFLTNTLHWPITRACCDMTWQAATEDKWLCSHILAGSSVRTPETLAVIDRSARTYPGTKKISSAPELRDFVTSDGVLPAFGKENRGICSFGAFVVLEADRDAVFLKGHGWLDYETCMDRFVGDTTYLLQRLESNHSFFERLTPSLATVRVCVLIATTGIKIPFAVLKLPAKANIADSFWRPGNLACGVDVETGRILTLRSRDAFGTTDHEVHPETGLPLQGETIPMWDRLIELAHACAPMFQPVRYQSMDIGIAPDGPFLVEINTGGGFDLPQLATGEGFLTNDVRNFFNTCGYKGL